METKDKFSAYSSILHEEVNHTLKKVSFISMIMGYGCGVLLFIMEKTALAPDVHVPILWTFIGGSFSFFAFKLASAEKIRSWVTYLILFGFLSMPSVLYVIAYLLLPSSTATFITGPASYLYYFMVILSGFSMEPRISILAGIIAGTEYYLLFLLGKDYLKQLSAPDNVLLGDITEPVFYFFKALMMVFSGFAMAVFSGNARRLINKILNEEQEKAGISRLFGQFVSDEVKNRIIHDKKGLLGEKKDVTILFSDIRGFSTLSEIHPPELVVNLLNEYLDRMVYCITKNGGVIDKFIGDAIMAVFGGVFELENSGESAFLAAQEMRVELSKLHSNWKERGLPILQNGIGLHFGTVIQGTVGSENRKEFTVIGDAVNTASRLEGLTKNYGYDFLLSESVFDQLSITHKELCDKIGNVTVKGRSKEILIYGIKK